METIRGIQAAVGRLRGCSVALGAFDGVHLGHQALFAEAVAGARRSSGRSAIVTFEPHPGKVLTPELAPKLLTTLSRKLELIEALGIEVALVQPFDRAYAALEADEFLERELFGALAPASIVVGSDFTFGRGRKGNLAMLEAACEARGVELRRLDKVEVEGVVISSTKIRELIGEGRVAAAARLLGRPFELAGVVERGEGRGRALGFPTANLAAETEVRPAHGVYAARTWVGGRPFDGVANIGRRPTFGGHEPTIEIFLFDFSATLYGARIAVELIDWIRGERKFESAAALSARIALDCDAARAALRAAPPPGPLSPGRAPSKERP